MLEALIKKELIKSPTKTWKADWNLIRLFLQPPKSSTSQHHLSKNSFSWQNANGKNYISPIKQQGLFNACSVFASLAVMEAVFRIQNPDDNESLCLSEGDVFFKSPGIGKLLFGWKLERVLEYLKTKGVLPANHCPFGIKALFTGLPEDRQEKSIRISSFTHINNLYEIKKWLREKGPMISVMDYQPDFIFYRSGIYRPLFGPPMGGHAVAVIGYDDERQAWICKNSWGSGWGEGGFFRIAYGSCGIDRSMVGICGLVH